MPFASSAVHRNIYYSDRLAPSMGLGTLLHTRATYADCHFKYPHAENPIPALPGFETIGVSLIIIILTIALELYVRPSRETAWEPRRGSTRETREISTIHPIEDDFRRDSVEIEATFAGNGTVATSTAYTAEHCQPSPKERANNFVVATIFIIPICIAFAQRIRAAQQVDPVEYDSFCRKEMYIARTQWWAVCVFNIVPLLCACMAWLRTLVECVLVRWNRSLTYEMWPPVWVLSMVARGVPIARNMVLWVMMRSSRTATRNKTADVEVGPRTDPNQERRGLMREESAMDDDEATVYDPRSSDEQLK